MADVLRRQLEEIHLIKCSLLPGELLAFTADAARWAELLDAHAADPLESDLLPTDACSLPPARFQVRLDAADTWFEVELPPDNGAADAAMPSIAVKGDRLGRARQELWQSFIADKVDGLRDAAFPAFELISAHLLPRLHAESEENSRSRSPSSSPEPHPVQTEERYHALFTSHHLKSTQKRRSLSQWSYELGLSGFAKVGHPGVIYCEGPRRNVEDFVSRVKAMQWLALRSRFVELVPTPASETRRPDNGMDTRRPWVEFEKVGEVVGEMRRIGRENYVVEMGIGSATAA